MNRKVPSIHCLHCDQNLRGVTGQVCPECGREFDRGRRETYAADGGMGRLGMLAGLCVLIAAAWFAASQRTQQYGPTLRTSATLLAASVVLCLTPALAIAWSSHRQRPMRRPMRGAMRLAAVTAVAATLIAEAWALPQELLFRNRVQSAPPPARIVMESRWPPFASSHIGFDPSSGLFFGGD